MKKSILFSKVMGILIILFLISPSHAQTVPIAEPVYGGYIEWIDSYALSPTSSRVFVSTMSPNSMFYATVSNVNTTTPSFSAWSVVPDLDANGNYGFINCFAVDENSGYVYASTMTGEFVGASTTASSIFSIGNFFVEAVEAYNSRLFYEVVLGPEEWMYVADLDASGNLISIDSSLIASSPGWSNQFQLEIHIHPVNNHVYLFVPGDPPMIYKSSDPYNTLSNTTTWSLISVSNLTATSMEYVSMGIAPDGRLFCGSYEGNSSGFTAQVSYSDADGDPWTHIPISDDCGRGEVSFSGGSLGPYLVYYSRVVSADSGLSWTYTGGADGAICGDPINENYAYVRTDWGIGFFDNYSGSVTEANTGLQAVQVNDWSMNQLKDTAWVASKSGLWHVSGYGGSSPVWSSPIWPQDRTVPWSEVETSIHADPMYCGNTNGDVFKWASSFGSYINPANYQIVFEAHMDASYPYYTWTYGTYTSAIAIDPYATNERIFVGLYDLEDWNEPEALGAIFVGEYSSGVWTFNQILGSPLLNDGCDVNDIVCVYENSHSVAYVAVDRNTTFGTVNGIYRIEETAPAIWTSSNDLFTAPGYPISASIADLCVSSNDSIFACGTDASGTTVVSYKKAIGDTYWEALPTGNLPFPAKGRAITYDAATYDVYMAVDNIVYRLPQGASSWSILWPYPNGTQIYCVYFDDLLVGTSTGLYMHPTAGVGIFSEHTDFPASVTVQPNPFKESTEIGIDLEKSGVLCLSIHDLSGKERRKLLNERLDSGKHAIPWNATDQQGNKLPKGVYLYKLSIQGKSISGKLIVQ